MTAPRLAIAPLTVDGFAGFGEVIAAAAAQRAYPINAGTTQRFDALGHVALDAAGHAVLSIFRAEARALPFAVTMLERHPLGSQAFVPLDPRLRYIVVVAESADATPQAFLCRDGQGVNFFRGTWHHPLIALDAGDFLVVDRAGPGANCEEQALATRWWLDPAG